MSVKLLDNEAFYGFRVRRTIQGKIYQEYFSLKDSGRRVTGAGLKRVKSAADKRDKALLAMQRNAKAESKESSCFRPDGSIKGVSYLEKVERNGVKTPIFQLGIASEKEKRVVCTSVSISAYGVDAAWKRTVDLYCKHKKISKAEALYTSLLAADSKYVVNA